MDIDFNNMFRFNSLKDFRNKITAGVITKYGSKGEYNYYTIIEFNSDSVLLGVKVNSKWFLTDKELTKYYQIAFIGKHKFITFRVSLNNNGINKIKNNQLHFKNGKKMFFFKPKPVWLIEVVFPKNKQNTFFSNKMYTFKFHPYIQNNDRVPTRFQQIHVKNTNGNLRRAIVIKAQKLTHPKHVFNVFYAEPIVKYDLPKISKKSSSKLQKHLNNNPDVKTFIDDYLNKDPLLIDIKA